MSTYILNRVVKRIVNGNEGKKGKGRKEGRKEKEPKPKVAYKLDIHEDFLLLCVYLITCVVRWVGGWVHR